MAAQSHRSNGLRGALMTAGPPESSPTMDCLGPTRRRIAWQWGTRAYMTSSGAIRVMGNSWIKILLFTCALLPLAAVPAKAQSVGGCVANFGGVIDGFVIG